MNEDKITLIIADDHPLFRSGVRAELETVPEYQIIGETGEGSEALEMIRNLHPQIAVLDFEMPGMTGLEIAGQVSENQLNTRIILLTMHQDNKIFHKALDLGIQGYVLKDDTVTDIIAAINTVASGKHFISDGLSKILIEKSGSPNERNEQISRIEELTAAEKRVLSLVAELKSNDEIAGILFISKRTVENHKVNITSKLGLKSSRQLLKFALEHQSLIR